jgi:hypothetical protein
MDAPDTCGKGLAAHATLPSKLAELLGALADNLSLHQETLDRSDPAARAEHDVYVDLERQYRDVVRQLTSIADHMDAARNLPMGKHDADRLADPMLFGPSRGSSRSRRSCSSCSTGISSAIA